jgi:hypothetical protein
MKRILVLSCIALFSVIALMQSCTRDAAYPEICFTSQIRPIYYANCAMTGCHDGSPNSEVSDIVLTDYAHIMEGIKPYHPGQSKYFNVLSGIGSSMPPKKSLSSTQVALIRAWIEQGAQETNCTSSSCDTTNVTYSGFIAGILSTNCTPCHNSSTSSGGVNIDGYTSLKTYLDANKTNFVNSISYNYTIKMPPSYKLTDCEIAQVNKWVGTGYPNN